MSQTRNKGYASEAIQIATKYAKEALGLIQLYCNILVSNLPSIQLFEKVGFTVSGKKIKWVKRGEVFEDELFLQHIF